MAIHNSQVAEIFNGVADLLEIEGANEFRIRAYRNAARSIGNLRTPVADMLEQGRDPAELPGIGDDLAGKIREIVQTGHLGALDDLQKRFHPNILELTRIPGLGPKRIRILDRLGINSREKLRMAAEKGRLHRISGFGEKTEKHLLQALEDQAAQQPARLKLIAAEQIANSVEAWLKRAEAAPKIAIAGSLRRRQETVGDIDILAACDRAGLLMERFLDFPEIKSTLARGDARSSVILDCGVQVDLRIVPPESFGSALVYFTGSKAHVIELRRIALRLGLKINEYGVFRGDDRLAGETEEEVYRAIGLPYIEPELRENTGEIAVAQHGELPPLVAIQSIRGDLHCHTLASDGRNSLSEMAEAARARGYEYLAITEHSKRVGIARGLDAARLEAQLRDIDELNDSLSGITLLKGVEVDILEDGSLDLPDWILAKLDVVIASIHSRLRLGKSKQTERLLRAIENPHCDIIGHPTGRLLNEREPMEIDMAQVMRAAREHHVAMEINGQPDRMDLDSLHCKMAREFGVKLAVSTDAHSVEELDFMRFGVGQARRGWLAQNNVLNCCSLEELRRTLGQ